MVVVDLAYRTRIQLFRGAASDRNGVEGAAFIEEQFFSVGHPVGRFEPARAFMDHFTPAIRDVDDLQPAAQHVVRDRLYDMRIGSIFMDHRLVDPDIPDPGIGQAVGIM